MTIEISTYSKPENVNGYTACVEGKDWILWEHEDGSISVSRTNGPGTGVVGEMVKL